MPSTAASLGTSTAALVSMSNVEQLDFVYRYLYPYRWKMKSYVDLYFAIFFPAAIGKSKDYVLQTYRLPATLIADQNAIYDLDKNRQITVGEVETAIMRKVPLQYQDSFKKKE
jgi:hypothetical protein